jgi:hypothetical protein
MPDTPTRTDRPPATVMANSPGQGFDLGAFATGALQLANTLVSQHTNPELRGGTGATSGAPPAPPVATPTAPAQAPGMLTGANTGKLALLAGAGLLVWLITQR